MAESVLTTIRLETSGIERLEALLPYVRWQGGYVPTRTDALREAVAKGMIVLDREVRATRPVRFDAPQLAGAGVQLVCRLDPQLVERADALAATLAKQVGLPIVRAVVLREAVERGLAFLENARDTDG